MDELVKLRQQITELQKLETKHQQVEESLTENEKKYRILVEMATDAIFIQTVEGHILECNTVGAKMFGYTKEEMIGLTLADLVPEEFTKTLPPQKAFNGFSDYETIRKKKDGTLVPVIISTSVVSGEMSFC